MSEEEKEKVLLFLRKSRKAFLVEYVCGAFLLLLLGVLYFQGVRINPGVRIIVIGLGMFSLVSAEAMRWMHYYKMTPDKLIISKGLVKHHKKNVSFFSLGFIPDIHLDQGRMQRLLNYGTVFLKSGEEKFEIKDVSNPRKVLKKLEEMIEKNKKHEGKAIK